MTALISGNLYNVESQSADTTTGTWSAADTNTTLTRDTTVFNDSPASFKLTATAAGAVSMRTSYSSGPLTPGNTVLRHVLRRRAGSNRFQAVLFNFIDSGGTLLLPQVNISASTDAFVANTFCEYSTADVTSPASTFRTQVVLTVPSMAAGESVYFDTLYLGPPPAPPNVAPTADAGVDQAVTVGTPTGLTGAGSDTDGTIASYAWTLTSKPSGSAAALTGTGASRSLTPDLAGAYVASLIVTDDDGATSAPDAVTITATEAPVVPTGPTVLVRVANTFERRKYQKRNATNDAWLWS